MCVRVCTNTYPEYVSRLPKWFSPLNKILCLILKADVL